MEVYVVPLHPSQEVSSTIVKSHSRTPLRSEVDTQDSAALDDREQISVSRAWVEAAKVQGPHRCRVRLLSSEAKVGDAVANGADTLVEPSIFRYRRRYKTVTGMAMGTWHAEIDLRTSIVVEGGSTRCQVEVRWVRSSLPWHVAVLVGAIGKGLREAECGWIVVVIIGPRIDASLQWLGAGA